MLLDVSELKMNKQQIERHTVNPIYCIVFGTVRAQTKYKPSVYWKIYRR